MPTPAEILSSLSAKAEAITKAIDRKQTALDRRLSRLERELFTLLQAELFGRLQFDKDGKLLNNTHNLALLIRIDKAFERFEKLFLKDVLSAYVSDLIQVSALTGEMYTGEGTDALIKKIAADNALLRASIGVTSSGRVVQGSVLWEVSQSAPVRQGVKNVVISAIQAGFTLKDLTDTLRDFLQGAKGVGGRLRKFWRTYAYDVFNQAAEIKNEQFRRGLGMQWFIYVGDIIQDSREFCISKAGKVFAVIEADTEWPNDPDLIGKNSGIPYTPRIDRGRWNCRHRIRYITEEMAAQLDSKKVQQIQEKYGSNSL